MRSKDFIEQMNIDKLTLGEIYKLDDLNIKKFSKFGKINLLSLVMVQLQGYLSSAIINGKTKPYSKSNNFPYITSSYLNKDTKFHRKVNKKNIKTNYSEFKSLLLSLIPFARISTLNVHSDIYEDLKKELNKRFVLRKKAKFVPIYLNFFDEQLDILDEYLKKFAKKNNIKNTNFSNNFIEYIKPYFGYERHEIDNSHTFFVGSNSILKNRIMSANYLLNKRTVISFNHANYNTLIIDEPHQEYAEHVFCNYYIDYGMIKKNNKILKSNFLPPKIINMSNPRLTLSSPKSKLSKDNIIYVPDAFCGDARHGPYRDMDDRKYYQFQKKIVSSKKNILIKKHPKTRKNYKFLLKKNINQKLSNIANDYPLFIVDRISQAFFELARGQSKILYFNIGRRKIRKDVINEIRKRAYVTNIDPYNSSKKNLAHHINMALNFKIKKTKIMELACITKKHKNEIFFNILKI